MCLCVPRQGGWEEGSPADIVRQEEHISQSLKLRDGEARYRIPGIRLADDLGREFGVGEVTRGGVRRMGLDPPYLWGLEH